MDAGGRVAASLPRQGGGIKRPLHQTTLYVDARAPWTFRQPSGSMAEFWCTHVRQDRNVHEFVQKLVNDFFGSKKMWSGRGKLELWLAVGFGFGLYSFFKGFRVYREYRVIEDTPEMPIRS